MAKSISNVEISTDTFAGWLDKTNLVIGTLANEIVTVENTLRGANTTGNGSVIGIFTANTLGTFNLRGGGIGNTANLSSITIGFSNSTVSSNVSIVGYTSNVSSNNLNITSNTSLGTGSQSLSVNVDSFYITTNSFNIDSSSNIAIDSSLTLTGDISVDSSINFTNKGAIDISSVTLAFPSNTTTNTVDSFAVSSYTGARYTISVTDENNANNKTLTELSVVYGFSNAHFTEYGTVFSNTQFITFSVGANVSHVTLYANSSTSNATFKILKTTFT